jgi:hypothetical protein
MLCLVSTFREISDARLGFKPASNNDEGSFSEDSVVIDETDDCILINFHEMCNDIYVCD